MKKQKYARVLDMFIALESGKQLSKLTLANDYEVAERTIQRDLDDIRAYYMETLHEIGSRELVYDRDSKRFKVSM